MDILKHQFLIKSLILLKPNCHAKMAPDTGFQRHEPFAHYRPDPFSVFMERGP
jgi:hypothetical protein